MFIHTLSLVFLPFCRWLNKISRKSPKKDGYTFIGWDADTTNLTSTMTVMAKYGQIFTVQFANWDGAWLSLPQEVTEGNSASTLLVPQRDGYVFSGWSVEFDSVYSDLVVYALYAQSTSNNLMSNTWLWTCGGTLVTILVLSIILYVHSSKP